LPDSRYCIVVPHYNHQAQFARMVPELAASGLPVIVVDDGSDAQNYVPLKKLCAGLEWVELLRQEQNAGKGSAMIQGAYRARELGFTHMLQIDADGQHALDSIAAILAASGAAPEALVSGLPVFGADVPNSRLQGRKFSLWWARVETLSTELQDVMCGFRVYPLDSFIHLCEKTRMGVRMQFDIEVMVRMFWEGTRVQFVPVTVSYPENGVSHFRLFGDNVAISLMHTRLFFGMLLRAPWLLMRNRQRRGDSGISKF
jgi:glycosyltransferase involved in cell wall biosynthesis